MEKICNVEYIYYILRKTCSNISNNVDVQYSNFSR